MQNPYDKKLVSRKKLLFSISNCVFVPILLTMTLNMIDESSNFGACWKHASTTNFKESKYMEDDNNNSNENSNVNVDSNITNGSGIIFIGDSRTVQMYSYLTNTWSNNTYSKAGVIKYGNDLFIAQGSMGLDWMKNTGIPAAKKYFTNGVSIVILMGVNDLRNQEKYIEYLNSNVSSWTNNGAKLYFVTVNPCDGDY